MRSISLLFIIVSILSCSSESQNSRTIKERDSVSIEIKESKALSEFEIDTIPDIKQGVNERSSSFIKNRLELLIGRSYKEKCEHINVDYPPKYVLFRAFKHEKEYEIWIANKRSDTLRLLSTLPICAVDIEPGPKLIRGDGKTPEGFYTCKLMYGSSNWFMWIKLNTTAIDDYGDVGKGSSFKLCLEYPLQIDRNRTKKFCGTASPGSAICIHGNCVTAGCLSFENRNFLPIFLSAKFHDSNTYGSPKIHIFPFRFTDDKIKTFSEEVYSEMSFENLKSFWGDIKEAYDLLRKIKKR